MTSFILSLAIRLTLIMIAGGLAALLLRHSSYAVRHVVIAATLACAIALPPLMVLMPEWRVGVLPSDLPALRLPSVTQVTAHVSAPAPATDVERAAPSPRDAAPAETQQSIRPVLVTSSMDASDTQSRAATVVAPFRPSLTQLALGVWLIGVVFGLLWIALGQIGLARLRRSATPLRSLHWRALLELERMHAGVAADVVLLASEKVSSPVTWGILKPVIVLPEAARSWTEERKRVVVRHEMAHIARRDAATQMAATLASIIYWVHPLVVLAARRLRGECERACDERVLEMGTPATDYAAHLLDVAKFARSFGASSIVSVAMARPSQLEGRLVAVLRAAPSRGRMSAKARASAVLVSAMMLIAISAFKPVVKAAKARDANVAARLDQPSMQSADARPAPTSITAHAGATAHASASASASTIDDAGHVHSTSVHVDVPAISTDVSVAVSTAVAAAVAPVALAAPSTPAALSPPSAEGALDALIASKIDAAAKASSFARMALPAFSKAFPTIATRLRLDTIISIPRAPFQPLTDSLFEKTVTAQPGGTLDLDLDTGGDITIVGTDDQKVSVRGKLGGSDWRETSVDLEERHGSARLVSRYEGSSGDTRFDNAFTIRVPKRFNVRLSSAGGDVRIENVDGSFEGQTGGGTIALERATGEAHLSTGGGDVHVARSKLDGSVSTGGGTVHFDQVTGNITGSSGSDAMRMGNAFYYKMPNLKGLESLPRMRMDAETMRATQEAMRASQEALREAQRSMRDSGMRDMTRAMKRAQIQMMRQRSQMDSAGSNMRWYQWNSDSADDMGNDPEAHDPEARDPEARDPGANDPEVNDPKANDPDENGSRVRSRHKEIIRDRKRGDTHSSIISKDGFIIIDKDGGSIELGDAPKGAEVTTGGGAIVIGKSRGDVRAQTGGGDIELGPIDGGADATTGAGDVTISLVGERPHPVNITSGKGSVELVLPADANVTLDLETAYTENYAKHAKIKGDWPLNVTETKDWDDSHGTPRKYVRVRQDIGKGGPVVRVRTVNGDISIKRGS